MKGRSICFAKLVYRPMGRSAVWVCVVWALLSKTERVAGALDSGNRATLDCWRRFTAS